MSKIKRGQKFTLKIFEILNREFGATNAEGESLKGWQYPVWPKSEPFLVDVKGKKREATVVWFPVVTDNPKSELAGDWLNVVSKGGDVITTTYVGDKPLADVEETAGKYVGKNHIVFARWEKKRAPHEFLGVYSCTKKGDVRTYKRIADSIDSADWQRR